MKVLRTLTLLAVSTVLLAGGTSCSKDEMNARDKADQKLILDYLETNNLEATRHKSGLYYKIHNEGNGENPTLNSVVKVKYKGWLLDGTVFDQTEGTNTYSQRLYNLIEGWQVGIRLIKPGGRITLYVPSDMGYGKSQAGSIPANSVLVFDVELVLFY
ncbi:MAG: FKBP-type peptidyl-prolyl cis-trans isomerase [Breznakibacter sp.]